jgi:hypothetical protein
MELPRESFPPTHSADRLDLVRSLREAAAHAQHGPDHVHRERGKATFAITRRTQRGVTVSENENLPTFASLVAYSTGLILGRFLVDIVVHRMAAHPRKGNRMSTANADVLELLNDLPEDCTPAQAEHIRRVRSKIQRGDDDYESGRILTHAQFRARMSPWLAG